MALAAVWAGAWVGAAADPLDDHVRRIQQVYQVPAVVVGVMRGGVLVDTRAYGVSQVELGVPASTQHAFEIGSISKQFNAWGILMLAEQGRLDLQAPLARYLPHLPPPWGKPTLHQLLGQISGLPDLEDAFG